ncbi:MAG: hypothetical protein ACTS73_05060 [Arsenophonus sp. NEOnobi-MAG3]
MICHEKSTLLQVSTKLDIICDSLHEFIRNDFQAADNNHRRLMVSLKPCRDNNHA